MGFTQAQMDVRFGAIADFADIGAFIDQPVRTYSSGMFVRLAFSVASNVDSSILVIDEALSVGDTAFQVKCMNRMHELSDSGVTMLFVSHNHYQVQRLCSRAIYLSTGALQIQSHPLEVISRYESDVEDDLRHERKDGIINPIFRFVDVRCESGYKAADPTSPIIPEGRPFTLVIRYAQSKSLTNGLQIGVLLKCTDGTRIFGETSRRAGTSLATQDGEHELHIQFSPNLLLPGSYSLSLSAFDADYVQQHGFIENALMLRVVTTHNDPLQRIGFVALPCQWSTAS
jgi:hypothetical protein